MSSMQRGSLENTARPAAPTPNGVAGGTALGMRVVTNILRAQHHEIQAEIDHLRATLEDPELAVRAGDLRRALERLEHRLTVHLLQEDMLFYPKLINHPEQRIQMIAYQVIKELGDLGETLDDFVKRWRWEEEIAAAPQEFRRGVEGLLSALESRLNMENNVLFPMLEE